MKEDLPPFKYWPKFIECNLEHKGTMPFVCLTMLYEHTIGKFDYDNGEMREWPDQKAARMYFYSLN